MLQTFPSEVANQPGFISTATPTRWRGDPLVRDRYYFTFPQRLFKEIVKAIGQGRFDEKDLERERELAKIVGDHSLNIGHWKGNMVSYNYVLPRRPLEFDQATREFLGISKFRAASMAKEAEIQLNSFDSPLRGYLGWLLSQRTFLSEHDELIQRYPLQIQQHGFPLPLNSRPNPNQYQTEEASDYTRDFVAFYSRWRLQTLAAPYIPLPLAPQLPDVWTSRAANLPKGGHSFFLPDISPVTGQGSINAGLNGALRGTSPPDHLAHWMDIVGKENTSRIQIQAFERRFRLQHFWILLHDRYPDAVRRRRRPLTDVFADFLGVESTTVKRDLDHLAKNVGPTWATRDCDLC